MWVRAVWMEGDKEEKGVLPWSWLKDKYVFWSPGQNAEKAMRNNLVPTSSWKMFDLIRVKHRSGNHCLLMII